MKRTRAANILGEIGFTWGGSIWHLRNDRRIAPLEEEKARLSFSLAFRRPVNRRSGGSFCLISRLSGLLDEARAIGTAR